MAVQKDSEVSRRRVPKSKSVILSASGICDTGYLYEHETRPFHDKCWNSWGNDIVLARDWTVLFPTPDSYVGTLPPRWGAWWPGLWKVTGSGWGPHDGISSLVRDTENLFPLSPFCKHLRKVLWGHSKKAAIGEPRRGLLKTVPAGTLTLDF